MTRVGLKNTTDANVLSSQDSKQVIKSIAKTMLGVKQADNAELIAVFAAHFDKARGRGTSATDALRSVSP